MQSEAIRFSEIAVEDRFTVEQFVSPAREVIEKIQASKYELAPIADIGEVRGGKRLPVGSTYDPEGIPYVRSTDIKDLSVGLSDVVYITEKQQAIIARYPLEYMDVVITIAGTIGNIGVLRDKLPTCQFNENMARITRIREDVNPEYLAVYLDSRFGQTFIEHHTGGAVQPKLSLERIKRVLVPLPPRPVQDRIAVIMQEAYATRRAMLAKAEELLGGIDECVLGELGIDLAQIPDQKRFVVNATELLGRRFEVDYHLPRLKAQYQAIRNGLYPVVELGSLISEMSGGATPLGARYLNEGIPFLRIQNITESGIDLSDVRYISRETHQQMKRSQTRPEDLLMTITGRVGTAAVVLPSLSEANTNQHMVIIRLANQQVSPHYLAAVINSSIVAFQAQHKTTGTTRVALDYKSIRSLLVPIPPPGVQETIVTAVQDRRNQAEYLRIKAQEVVSEAKERVERIILGEEDVG